MQFIKMNDSLLILYEKQKFLYSCLEMEKKIDFYLNRLLREMQANKGNIICSLNQEIRKQLLTGIHPLEILSGRREPQLTINNVNKIRKTLKQHKKQHFQKSTSLIETQYNELVKSPNSEQNDLLIHKKNHYEQGIICVFRKIKSYLFRMFIPFTTDNVLF